MEQKGELDLSVKVKDKIDTATNMAEVAQKIAKKIEKKTKWLTISDKNKEFYYYDKEAKLWREDASNLVWYFVNEEDRTLKKHILGDIIHYLQGLNLVGRQNFHAPEGWISFKNHSLDAKHNYSLEIDDDPGLYIQSRFPVKYDSNGKCPNFTAFVDSLFDEEEDKITLLETMALVLIPHINFEKAVMYVGSGANGKSTLMKVLKKIIGKENTIGISLQSLIENRFMSQQLDGALANIYADIDDKRIKDLGPFKLMVSGDNITVESKGGHPYTINPTTIHYFSSNALPEITENNLGVWRRFVMLDFPKSFAANGDLNLLEKITTDEELEGIVCWLVVVAKKMVQQGGFTYPQSLEDLQMRWRLQSNACIEMIEKSGLVKKQLDGRISKREFYELYVQYCNKKKFTIKTDKTLSQQMTRAGYKVQKSGNERYWEGISKVEKKDGQEVL